MVRAYKKKKVKKPLLRIPLQPTVLFRVPNSLYSKYKKKKKEKKRTDKIIKLESFLNQKLAFLLKH